MKRTLPLATIAAVALLTAATGRAQTRLAMDIGGATATRVVNGQTEWVYQWPGVYFEARFRGDRVSLRMDDPGNDLNVLVDNRAAMVLKRPGATVVSLDHLGPGEHTIRLEKRTETQASTGAFAGFFVPGREDALPPVIRPRRILFLGDSLTVGYGNRSAFLACTKDELFDSTDTNAAFAPLTAKHFNAEYQVRAFSGLGLIRNYGGVAYPQYHLPTLWPRAIFADPQPAADWTPQVLVISIGGNDFSTQVHPGERWETEADLAAEYTQTYVAFLKHLRKTFPKALLVMAWTGDKSPLYTQTAAKVFTQAQAEGIANLDHLEFPKLERTGCAGHPNIHDDSHIAELLEALIASHQDAWQGQ